MSKSTKNIIWIDMEMTGLNPDEDRILEVACLVTNKNLEIISDEFNVVINQPKSILDNMSPWCIEQHSKSGLINESLRSTVTISEAEEKLLKFIQNKTPQGECPLAGNSVYMDKFFLIKHMNRVANHLHYRIIDVSSFFEVVRRWYPHLKLFKKSGLHRALPDIKDSILQLKYYRKKILKPVDGVRR
ncbi:oligoribonuclease, mitochondrial [Halyomorpha halys]|uniref:oligoribonuclease, mitochondrial n=1 Tax=Halyomorpha halys TaxID=286706 RepID=UPI0006D4D763|nr:oligoribonuclease, mitochondrial isoform X2 [Halyomorpha halys]